MYYTHLKFSFQCIDLVISQAGERLFQWSSLSKIGLQNENVELEYVKKCNVL